MRTASRGRAVVARRLSWAALAATLIPAVFLVTAPLPGGRSTTMVEGVRYDVDLPPRTMPQANGPRAYLLLLVPLALIAPAALAHRTRVPRALRWASAGLLTTLVLLAAMSIGYLFIPAALLAIAAAFATPSSPTTT